MNKIIVVLVIGVIVMLYIKRQNTKEAMENEPTKYKLAVGILNVFSPQTSFIEYLEILKANGNTSYQLISQDTYYELKFLMKDNKLTVEKLMSFMTDM